MSKTILLSHSGKQHAYHVAKALLDLGRLEKFYTSSYIRSEKLQKYLLKKGDSFWSRRFLKGLGGSTVQSNWRFEMKEMLYARLYGKSAKTQLAVYERDVKFDQYLSSKISFSTAEIFWGFQGSCYESLKSAKKHGKLTICELTTAHIVAAKKILGEEKLLHPEWADSFDNLEFPPFYEERLCNEPFEADKVIAASEFTKQSLLDSGVEKDNIHMLPLGCEIEHIGFKQDNGRKSDQPLKVLYAGRITQRKGIKYLLEAVKKFSRSEVELHIIGHIHGSGEALKEYKGVFQIHPPVSQKELFLKYLDFDVLVIPSVFEGFGLVIIEAMAAGLPVIATPNSMGPDVIDHGINGYIVPIRDSPAIVLAIEKLLSKSDESYAEMRKLARRAAQHYSWNAYRDRLGLFLESMEENG